MSARERGIRRLEGSGGAGRLAAALLVVALAGCAGEEAPSDGGQASASGSATAADTAPVPPIAEGPAPLRTVQAAEGDLPGRYGFGRTADSAEIARRDIDVLPDGTGLPPGSGSVSEGAEVYRTRCASCHGPTGREGAFTQLVSPPDERTFPSSQQPFPPTTIGNYWPYATSLFDYVARAMPMQEPGSLETDEVYAVVAWLLHQNGIVEADAVMNPETLPEVRMPARGHFRMDDRTGGSEIR